MEEPRAEYGARLSARRAAALLLRRWDTLWSWVRGGLAVGTLVLAYLVLGHRHLAAPPVLVVPVALFVAVLVAHDRVARRAERVARAIGMYEGALARLDGAWDRQSEDGHSFLTDDHPFAADVDLFGPHSLFQKLCTARTAAGRARLAAWLGGPPAEPEAIRARQRAVEELAPMLELRESMWVAGEDVRAEVDAAALDTWARAPARLPWRGLRVALAALATCLLALAAGWLAGRVPGSLVAVAAGAVTLATVTLNARATEVVNAVARPESRLALVAALCRVVESALGSRVPAAPAPAPAGAAAATPATSRRAPGALLQAIHARLMADGRPASARIADLAGLLHRLEWQKNLMFAPIGYALLWRPQIACAIEAWRTRSGRVIGAWLDALADMEALSALSTHAFENPGLPFPTLIDAAAADGPRFSATALRHPLLPACVPNDLALGGRGSGAGPRLVVLSGSNMSGKSTLMRSVGLNVALGLAGAPVHADALELSPLAVGATLRIQDSLSAGTSRFYAEITRLRQLVELARGPRPLLFLIDEILAGTNSHDRRLGAAAVLRGLVELGAIGIASTHDLALTEVVNELPGRAANLHFEDHLEGTSLVFDYRLRPGVVQHSNAIALMRAVGLEV
jgi:hypothetical protein